MVYWSWTYGGGEVYICESTYCLYTGGVIYVATSINCFEISS